MRGEPTLRVLPARKTTIGHYPISDGQVVVRWRGDPHPDEAGYIVEANIGGVVVEGSGHYGTDLLTAKRAGERIRDRLSTLAPGDPQQGRLR